MDDPKIRKFLKTAPAEGPVFAVLIAHHTPGCRCGWKDGQVVEGPWLGLPKHEQDWATTAKVGDRLWNSGSTDLIRLR